MRGRVEDPTMHPALLPPGASVGPWRVVAWAGRGVYGAVYKAVHSEQEHAAPVALKLALLPGDPRFVREAELLHRLKHPCIPLLRDRGEWRHSSGVLHPYLAMEWIEGMPLYDWAREHNPSSEQVLRLMAQLARALEALHALGAVHRDVKGANILVRLSDGRAFLTDLGSGNYPGATTLTPYDVIPGTPAYHSPEAWMFPLRFGRDRAARYQAGPADDLFALGMTGYRLLTGEYLEPGEPFKDAAGNWQLETLTPATALVDNPRVSPELKALILRMLSVHPEQRGTAAELADALELAARSSAPPSVSPSMAPQTLKSSTKKDCVKRVPSRAETGPRRALLTMATAALALIAWAWWSSTEPPRKSASVHAVAPGTHQEDGGTAGLGDAVSATSVEKSPGSSDSQALTEDPLPELVPGQIRPDAAGRCPHKLQVALNGGCWVPIAAEECEAAGGQVFKSRCYVPAMTSKRQRPLSPSRKP
jgi:serine/threonine protein kinase